MQSVPIVIADADDADSLSRMAAGTDVIISTAGPFAKYGDKVVAAAVKEGSHYCDITGEDRHRGCGWWAYLAGFCGWWACLAGFWAPSLEVCALHRFIYAIWQFVF